MLPCWLLQSRRFIVILAIACHVSRALRPNSCSHRTLTIMGLKTEKVKHVPKEIIPSWMKQERTKTLVQAEPCRDEDIPGSVVYWMQRDMRTKDNWAMLWAAYLAASRSVPLHVVYTLQPTPKQEPKGSLPPALIDLPMSKRHGMFLIGGLEHVYRELKEQNVPMHVLMPTSNDDVGRVACQCFLEKLRAEIVVCDFTPIRHYRQWNEQQAAPLLLAAGIPFYQVDAHNIVPVWESSDKREVGARTLRPRIHKKYNEFCQPFPEFKGNKDAPVMPHFDRYAYEKFFQMDESVPPVDWCKPGTDAAMKQFDFFINNGLQQFHELRNDPTKKHIISNLSPWINHGHVSFQRLAMEIKKLNKYANGTAAYIEEGVIRRELSDNFLYYTPNDYDSLDAAAGWAKETLHVHANDPREYLYSLQELESGETHEDIWNAAQLQLVREGKLHGFMRMYWAKKILEWTESPTVALRTAQYFNDKYALDGKDPNGFVGVGWSIMGIHDQGWKEREIFGKIRFMNYNGCKRKFNIKAFVEMYEPASENALRASAKKSDEECRQQALSGLKSLPKKQKR